MEIKQRYVRYVAVAASHNQPFSTHSSIHCGHTKWGKRKIALWEHKNGKICSMNLLCMHRRRVWLCGYSSVFSDCVRYSVSLAMQIKHLKSNILLLFSLFFFCFFIFYFVFQFRLSPRSVCYFMCWMANEAMYLDDAFVAQRAQIEESCWR